MNAKIAKLEQQFQLEAKGLEDSKKQSDLFKGVAIFVNGHSEPPAEVLRSLMLQHGGVFHDYQVKQNFFVRSLPLDRTLHPLLYIGAGNNSRNS